MAKHLDYFFSSLFPEGFHIMDLLPTLGFIVVVAAVLGILIHTIADKAARYNHALSSAMALLFMYLAVMMLHGTSAPDFVKEVLKILPLVDYNGSQIILFQFASENFMEFFREFLYAFILSFVLIGLDDLIPDAKGRIAWIILQLFIICAAVFLYCGVIKAIDVFAPGILDSYAPLILGCILLFMVLLGILKVILSLLLVTVNPLLGAISLFFSTAPLGRALGKATLCALLLCAVTFFMGSSGFTTIQLAEMSIGVGLLPTVVLMGLWFLFGCIL